jgi:hypothetical protein
MKKSTVLFCLIIGLWSFYSCNQRKQTRPVLIENCKIYHDSDTLKSYLFPFKLVGYNTKRLLKYFIPGTRVDSIERNNEGFITRDYTFQNGNSSLSFFVKINHLDGDNYFYINNARIKSPLLKSDIEINMSRNDFFRSINSKVSECDTLFIEEGDVTTSYSFIFSDNKLIQIDINTIN